MNAFMLQFLKASGRPDHISLTEDRPLYGHQTLDEASVLGLPGFQYWAGQCGRGTLLHGGTLVYFFLSKMEQTLHSPSFGS